MVVVGIDIIVIVEEIVIIEGSLEVKLPTIWTDEKQRWEESEKRREEKRRRKKIKKRKSQKIEDGRARKGRKVAKSCVFPMVCGSAGSKSRGSLKRRVRSQLAKREMKNRTPLWREAHFRIKMHKTPQPRSTFRSCDVEKVHAVVAGSTFRSQKCKKK